jgi:hypothetical protein
MAVAYDAFSQSATATGELSWTHTPVGTPRGVEVYISQNVGLTDEVTGVTYGGVTMTRDTNPAANPVTRNSSEDGAVYKYFLGSSIPTGAQTVVVSVDATGSSKRAFAITVTAAADTEVVDCNSATGSTANPSTTLVLGGRTCFCSLGFWTGRNNNADSTPLTNWTTRSEVDLGATVIACYTYDVIGSTDVTAGWTMNLADNYAMIASAVSEAAGATAALSGTAGDGTAESLIVAGGETIILTLTNDTWVAAGATFDAQRQNIIDGIDSAQAEAAGWDAQRSNIAVTDVVRTSATVVTITLPALASYAITANETITATIPATALTGAAQLVASPTFVIVATGLAVEVDLLTPAEATFTVPTGFTVLVESGPAPTPPDTPTCTVTGTASSAVQAASSTFGDADGDLHAASQWQVDIAAGDFSSPVVDSGATVTDLLSITIGGLTPSTDYQIRVRHKDDSADAPTEWSNWSAADTFTTAAAPTGGAHHGRANGLNRRRFGGLWD